MLQELFVRLAVQATGAGEPGSRLHSGEGGILRRVELDAQLHADTLASALTQTLLQTTFDGQGPDHGGTGGLGGSGGGGLV